MFSKNLAGGIRFPLHKKDGIEVVAAEGIYHILLLWHTCQMKAVTMETLCEGWFSELRYLERRNSVGRSISLPNLIDSCKLRILGFQGSGGDG